VVPKTQALFIAEQNQKAGFNNCFLKEQLPIMTEQFCSAKK